MMNKSKRIKFLSLVLAASGFVLASGDSAEVSAQRDPFSKTNAPAPRTSGSAPRPSNSSGIAVPKPEKPKPAAPAPVGIPAIEDRIAYYKRLRETAAAQNQPIPKVTSVLTLGEMSVVGIFRTPRGYAAMVEAKPIKLSYTIYPGEKFFDGQLVAIEENRLVFRRVTKWTNGKFVASEENKSLRQYTVEQEVQGTAPVETTAKTTETPANPAVSPDEKAKTTSVISTAVIASPLEEMNNQPVEKPKEAVKTKTAGKGKKTKTGASKAKSGSSSSANAEKKTVKVAQNQDQ